MSTSKQVSALAGPNRELSSGTVTDVYVFRPSLS